MCEAFEKNPAENKYEILANKEISILKFNFLNNKYMPITPKQIVMNCKNAAALIVYSKNSAINPTGI